MKVGRRAPPADDAAPVPPPLEGLPTADRVCDLVLTGGVASGVVYPWAIVELARHFHFQRIAGSSVGAMAAALAAAGEYGRRNGHRHAFEALRRAPEQLGEQLPDGQTRMLSLFQPRVAGRRLLGLFVAGLRATEGGARSGQLGPGLVLGLLLRAFWLEVLVGALLGLAGVLGIAVGLVCIAQLLGVTTPWPQGAVAWLPPVLLALLGALAGGLLLGWFALGRDLRHGLVEHGFGLCAGAAADVDDAVPNPIERDRPGLTDWLHEGIQRSAGLTLDDAPLTFRDLWRAPTQPSSVARGGDDPRERAIDLVMLTTNVTQMQPVRLPHLDQTQRLFFDPERLLGYFPPPVLAALKAAAKPWNPDPTDRHLPSRAAGARLLELPGADLPLVVAARLSLSFPLLFSAIPLYAIDFDSPEPDRGFRRVWFSDGGLCSNFPIHLFDAALPASPTFGLWLDQRACGYPEQSFWLPRMFLEGASNGAVRFDEQDSPQAGPWRRLFGFVGAGLQTAKDWSDRATMRMPQTRHRVARLNLLPGEGALNIAMGRSTILGMAHTYGTLVGRAFVAHWLPPPGQRAAHEWDRQRWVRFRMLVPALRRLLGRFERSAQGSGTATPLDELIERARDADLLIADDPARLTQDQAEAWKRSARALAELEQVLRDPGLDLPLPGPPGGEPELRLRPPV